jgi:DNA mismatch repair protein MutS
MIYRSILFDEPHDESVPDESAPPSFFHDLNLDQLIDRITAGYEEYAIATFYYSRLNNLDAITYRQEIMQEMDDNVLMQAIRAFSSKMRTMRQRLNQANKLDYKHTKERLFLGAVEVYCEAVVQLSTDLTGFDLQSRGLRAFREYLKEYIGSVSFRNLIAKTQDLKTDLSAIRYSLLINANSVTVRGYNAEPEYSVAVEETFEKFRRDATSRYKLEIREWEGMNHVEGEIQKRIALLHPDVFRSLEAFCVTHAEYLDERISRFEREIQFYVSYLSYLEPCRRAGLNFCRPQLSQTSKEVHGRKTFDFALAGNLIGAKTAIVCNDFFLRGAERIFVVSGPNQGGKTTFARTFGQLHYLASLGCLVPGEKARLFLFDDLFTHFERTEDISNLRGKLQDDLVRIHHILEQATPNSLIVMNEIFSSTTLNDAVFLSKRIIARISALDLLAVCVTFLDELASFDEKTVSVVSMVDPKDPAVRTYKLERKPADGLAYALAIAEKHQVTYERLKERIQA